MIRLQKMASRSSKKSTVVTKTTTSSATKRRAGRHASEEMVADDTASTVQIEDDEDWDVSSASSVLSPTRTSRVHEKQQLSGLNNRLAVYIDKVRSLEQENQRLAVQIRSSEETVTRERAGIRAAFEAELSDARRLLDETAKEKARLQIEADKARAEFDGFKGRISKQEKDLKESENRRLYNESMVQDLQAKLNNSEAQRKHWEDEFKRQGKEADTMGRQLATARSQLEDETLLRVDLENRLQSMREELAFNKTLYDQELEEVRTKRQTEIDEIGNDMEADYQLKLRDQLDEMRAQFDAQLRRNRAEVEAMFETKLAAMQANVEKSRASAGSARDELYSLRSQVDKLEKERNHYHSLVDGLERKVKDLESRIAAARDEYFGHLGRKDEEIAAMRAEIARMINEYQDLMDTKIQLDVEIQAYRHLLEGEEDRLNLSSENTASSRKRARLSTSVLSGGAEGRGTKRRRFLQEKETGSVERFDTKGEAEGDVEIADHDIDGAFVKLRNNGKEDVSLGNWVLKRTAGDEEVCYKFHSRSKIEAGAVLTVWGKAAGKKHSPPEDYVMKEAGWPTGDRMRSELTDGDEEAKAWRESSRSSNSSSFSFRTGLRPDLDAADPDGRCSIM